MPFNGSNFVGRGFNLTFELQPSGGVLGQIVFNDQYTGPPGIVHGGAVAAVLDEAMTATVFHRAEPAFTVRLAVNYRQPVYVGATMRIEAWLDRAEGRKRWLMAEVRDASGAVCANAEGLFILMSPEA